MDIQEQLRRRDYARERIKEIKLERQRLNDELPNLKSMKDSGSKQQNKLVKRRINYIKIRSGELRNERAKVAADR